MALHNGNICVVQHIVLSNAYTNSMCCYTPVYSIEHRVEQLVSIEQRIYWCESTLLKLPDVNQMNKGRKRKNNYEVSDLVRISVPKIDHFGTDRPTLPCKIL